jgi:hypothetical protein
MGLSRQLIQDVIDSVRRGERNVVVVACFQRYAEDLLSQHMRSFDQMGIPTIRSNRNTLTIGESKVTYVSCSCVEETVKGLEGQIFWDDSIWLLPDVCYIYDRVMAYCRVRCS